MRKTIKEIIEAFKEVRSYKGAGRILGIDRRTVKKWVTKGRSSSKVQYVKWKGLTRASTKPKKIHKRLTLSQEDQVLAQRRKTGSDAEKLKHEMARRFGVYASESTLYRTMKRRKPELLRNVLHYRRPQFQNGHAMRPRNTLKPGYFQADVKYVTPELSGLPFTCFEYAFVDIFSRFKLALILPVLDESGMILTLKYVLQESPFKIVYVQTDNGLENQSLFDRTCEENKITHYYIHKNSPNENAVVERTFRTDQDEFFFRLDKAPTDINELNAWFQKFLTYYNYERLHFSLHFKTPYEILEEGGYIKS